MLGTLFLEILEKNYIFLRYMTWEYTTTLPVWAPDTQHFELHPYYGDNKNVFLLKMLNRNKF